jgi:hypothetical protein
MHQFKCTFELGGDITPKEGEQQLCIANLLTDKDTFTVVQKAIDGVTKSLARSPNHDHLLRT